MFTRFQLTCPRDVISSNWFRNCDAAKEIQQKTVTVTKNTVNFMIWIRAVSSITKYCIFNFKQSPFDVRYGSLWADKEFIWLRGTGIWILSVVGARFILVRVHTFEDFLQWLPKLQFSELIFLTVWINSSSLDSAFVFYETYRFVFWIANYRKYSRMFA